MSLLTYSFLKHIHVLTTHSYFPLLGYSVVKIVREKSELLRHLNYFSADKQFLVVFRVVLRLVDLISLVISLTQ